MGYPRGGSSPPFGTTYLRSHSLISLTVAFVQYVDGRTLHFPGCRWVRQILSPGGFFPDPLTGSKHSVRGTVLFYGHTVLDDRSEDGERCPVFRAMRFDALWIALKRALGTLGCRLRGVLRFPKCSRYAEPEETPLGNPPPGVLVCLKKLLNGEFRSINFL